MNALQWNGGLIVANERDSTELRNCGLIVANGCVGAERWSHCFQMEVCVMEGGLIVANECVGAEWWSYCCT